MTKVLNANTTVPTPLPMLREALENLKPGQKVNVEMTREEVLRTQRNLLQRRHEIPGADSHLEYIEAMIIAEADGKLSFRQ
jgi:TusA-related sulfurtransferase